MTWLEIKKNICNKFFVLAVALLYIMFLLGDSGTIMPDATSTTIIGAIWNRIHGNWHQCADAAYAVRMYSMWTDNTYLPILMPLICGIPSVMIYLDEVITGNKRWILSRCSLKKYYFSKIIGNLASTIMIVNVAIAIYYCTLMCFFDGVSVTEEWFSTVYFVFSGYMPETLSEVSMTVIVFALVKGVALFGLYSIVCSSFCLLFAVLCKDKYTTFGMVIFLSYVQSRAVEELTRKYILEGNGVAGNLSDILNPVFLHYAGMSGFYMHRTWLALLVSITLIIINYGMFVHLSKRQLDFCER